MQKIFLFILVIILTSPSLAITKAPIKILIIGDSLTEGYGVTKEEAYPYQVEVLLKKKGKNVKVINAGSSGSTTASASSRLKWHIRSKPHILILSLGANDGLRGIKVKSTKKNLSRVISLASSHGIKVLLAGMKLPYNYGKKYRQEFEKVFKDLVKEHGIGFIPFLLKGVGGVKDLNLPDGIHPNKKGHQIIAQTVIKYLLEEHL